MLFACLLLMVSPESLAAEIDARVVQHWQAEEVEPAPAANDRTFLRRLTLDLLGRIPSEVEARAFGQDSAPDRRARMIRRVQMSPEHPLHLGRVLDDLIQGRLAGDPEFLDYLRRSAAQHRTWDQIFRDVVAGPWDTKERKQSERFLSRRLNSVDDLTNDTARVFFGVDVSCARCHDHPLVQDWKQDHYFGMVEFFNPTYEASKAKRGASIQEKATAAVSFVTTKGQRKTARSMFLSGRVVTDAPGAGANRREQLVQVALDEKTYLSRAIVNRLWAYFLGRGLVNPVDQLHSANPPAIPDLLEWLAEDFVVNGYNLERLVTALVSSRVYQLESKQTKDNDSSDRCFARASLRALTPHQFALSLAIATGDGSLDRVADAASRVRHYRELEGKAAALTKPGVLDTRAERFQSSTGEALFLSNHPDVQRWLQPTGKNLTARLATSTNTHELVETAYWTILSRPPDAEESAFMARWVESRPEDRAHTCGQLVWALLTSAEFRFNH